MRSLIFTASLAASCFLGTTEGCGPEAIDLREMMARYSNLIRLAPDNAEYYAQRGDSFLGAANCGTAAAMGFANVREMVNLAIDDFSEAIRRAPDSADYYMQRGEAYIKIKDHARAEKDLTEAIRLSPTAARFRYVRAVFYFERKKYDDAITDFTDAIKFSSDKPIPGRYRTYDNQTKESLIFRSAAYYLTGERDKAKVDADSADVIRSVDTTALDFIRNYHRELSVGKNNGDKDTAATVSNKRQEAFRHFIRGLAFYHAIYNQYLGEALKEFKKAKAFDEMHIAYDHMIMQVYFKSKSGISCGGQGYIGAETRDIMMPIVSDMIRRAPNTAQYYQWRVRVRSGGGDSYNLRSSYIGDRINLRNIKDTASIRENIDDLTAAIRLLGYNENEKMRSYIARGNYYAQLGNQEQARRDYIRGIMWMKVGSATNLNEKYISLSEELTALYPSNPKYHALLANALLSSRKSRLENRQKAIAAYSNAIRFAPNNATYRHSRGKLFYEQGSFDSAIVDFTAAIELNSKSIDSNAYHAERRAESPLTYKGHVYFAERREVEYLFDRGRAYVAKNDKKNAAADFARVALSELSRIKSESARIHMHDVLLSALSIAMRQKPNDPELYEARAKIYMLKVQNAMPDDPNTVVLDESRDDPHPTKTNAIRKKDVPVYLDSALADINKAIALLNSSAIDPRENKRTFEEMMFGLNENTPQYKLGGLYIEKARAHMRKGNDKDSVIANLAKGTMYNRGLFQNDRDFGIDMILAAYDKVISDHPDERLTYEAKIEIMQRAQDNYKQDRDKNKYHEEILTAYDRLIELSTNNKEDLAVALISRGDYHYKFGDLTKAVADVAEALMLLPSLWDGWASYEYSSVSDIGYYRSNILSDSVGVIALINELIRRDPKNAAEYYYQRGKIYAKSGNDKRSLADFDRAIRMAPKVAEYRKERGYAHLENGDRKKAIADHLEALRLAPETAPYFFGAKYSSSLNEEYITEFTEAATKAGLKIKYPDFVYVSNCPTMSDNDCE